LSPFVFVIFTKYLTFAFISKGKFDEDEDPVTFIGFVALDGTSLPVNLVPSVIFDGFNLNIALF
jgi:hypothetical protein